MSNNKKSSVEWYAKQSEILHYNYFTEHISKDEKNQRLKQLKEQAKAMHKEEQEQLSAGWAKLREQTRETAMHIGFARGFECGLKCYEDYYQALYDTNSDEDEFTRNYITDRVEETYGENKK